MKYATDSKKFRQFVTNYCQDLNIPYPSSYCKRKEMRLQYAMDIKKNDMPDDEMTLMSWLDETYLKKVNEVKTFGLGNITGLQASVCIVDDFPTQAAPTYNYGVPKCCKKEQEKEDTMNYNEIEASRKYLNSRSMDVYYTKLHELEKQFKLDKKDRPATYAEMIDAIKNGNYTLDTKKTARIDACVEADGYYYGSMLDGIKWKLPDGPDFEGYNVAQKALIKAQTDAKDVINTADAAAGLKALQDFEAWTYTAPATAQ